MINIDSMQLLETYVDINYIFNSFYFVMPLKSINCISIDNI